MVTNNENNRNIHQTKREHVQIALGKEGRRFLLDLLEQAVILTLQL
jgi:hypothetical protein